MTEEARHQKRNGFEEEKGRVGVSSAIQQVHNNVVSIPYSARRVASSISPAPVRPSSTIP